MIAVKLKFGWFESKSGNVQNKAVFDQSGNEIGSYTGETRDGEIYGNGELIIRKQFANIKEDDVKLIGKFGKENHLENGEIIYNYLSDSKQIIYRGNFIRIDLNGNIEGDGVYIFRNIFEFHGAFTNGKPNGTGKQINKRYLNGGRDPIIIESTFKEGNVNGKSRALYANGTLYEGDLIGDGIRHGFGLCTYKTGRGKYYDESSYEYGLDFKGDEGFVYEGEWQSNNRHGKGILKNAKGEVLADGVWENNKLKTGYLVATFVYYLDAKGAVNKQYSYYESGQILLGYKGQIENHVASKGKMEFADGAVYDGDWKNDKFNGQGKLKLEDGTIYEGIFKNNQLHGQGKHIFGKGSAYEGEFNNGSYNGKGKLTSDNGDMYEGFFNDSQMHGKGKFSWVNGDVFEGEWKENKKNGEGKMKWASGEYYEGNFVNNVREGAGRMYWPNGDVYDGEWKNDLRNGQGKFTQPEGSVYDGEWKDGIRSGQGKSISSKGNVYVGDWLNNYENGYGEMNFKDEEDLKYIGNWSTGVMQGHGELTKINGEKLIGTFWLFQFIEGIRLGANGEQIESGFFAMDDNRTCVTSLANNLIQAGEFDEAIEVYTGFLDGPVLNDIQEEKVKSEIEKIKILKKESETKNLLQELRDGSPNISKNDFDDFE